MESERPTPKLNDTEATRAALERWFRARKPQARELQITALKIPEGSGMSNITVLFDLHWEEGGERRTTPCVGRIEPEGGGKAFPEYDLALQYRVMEQVGKHSAAPVPVLMGLEEDSAALGVPFYIMRRLDGVVPPDMPPFHMEGWVKDKATPEQRRTMWMEGIRTMAQVHKLDPVAAGLGFVAMKDPGATPLERQINYWRRYTAWALGSREYPAATRALDWLHANMPANETFGFCWGDSRIGNTMYKPDLSGVLALLDWEMATLGNPLQDLAWWNVLDKSFTEGLGVPPLEGFPAYSEGIALWQRETGLSVEHYDYYELFATVRYAVIIANLMAKMGIEEMVLNNHVSPMLEKMVAEFGA